MYSYLLEQVSGAGVQKKQQQKKSWKEQENNTYNNIYLKDYFISHHLCQIVLLINLASLRGNKIQWYLLYFIFSFGLVSLSISNFFLIFFRTLGVGFRLFSFLGHVWTWDELINCTFKSEQSSILLALTAWAWLISSLDGWEQPI